MRDSDGCGKLPSGAGGITPLWSLLWPLRYPCATSGIVHDSASSKEGGKAKRTAVSTVGRLSAARHRNFQHQQGIYNGDMAPRGTVREALAHRNSNSASGDLKASQPIASTTMGAGRLSQLFNSALRDAFVHPVRSKVAIALSGGPDSMALAGLMVEWASKAHLKVSNKFVRPAHRLMKHRTSLICRIRRWRS